MQALGTTWHPEHFVCTACGQPIRESSFNVQDGMPYHAACYRDQVAPHCAYCGKPLIGEYLIDSWGTKFCKEHQGQYPHCAYCGRLVPLQQQEQGPGKKEAVRCPICRSTAIETSHEAQPLFRQCIQWVSGQGMKYNNLRLSLELVDRAKLAQYLSVHNEPHALGATLLRGTIRCLWSQTARPRIASRSRGRSLQQRPTSSCARQCRLRNIFLPCLPPGGGSGERAHND